MIVVVDYGVGNLGSIANMLRKIGVAARVSSDPADIAAADRLILPGVGAFAHGMASLAARGLVEPLRRRVIDEGTPVLGLCLGMQLLARHSDEGDCAGLGWIEADVIRFAAPASDTAFKVPQMGWNTVAPQREHRLLSGLDAGSRFYFVHSYHLVCADASDVVAMTDYGVPFASIVARDNIMGVQFHPEKSHKFGMRLLANFAGQGS